MKILVTGVTGQLGFDVMRVLRERGIACRGVGHAEFPLTQREAVLRCITTYKPDVVVHCAAYTAVDKAEDEPALCEAVNAVGTRFVAEACAAVGAAIIYISTDYVFDGEGMSFYETDAPKGPQNVYGRTKLAGELAVQEMLDNYYIVRISWVFGLHGNNFIRTMLRLAESHPTLRVVADQYGSPTYTRDLAVLLADMAQSRRYGIYHATNEGVCSWAELAAEVFRQRGLGVKVVPVPSSAYPTKAVRPKNSRLSKDCLDAAGFARLPAWPDAVRRYLAELAAIGE